MDAFAGLLPLGTDSWKGKLYRLDGSGIEDSTVILSFENDETNVRENKVLVSLHKFQVGTSLSIYTTKKVIFTGNVRSPE